MKRISAILLTFCLLFMSGCQSGGGIFSFVRQPVNPAPTGSLAASYVSSQTDNSVSSKENSVSSAVNSDISSRDDKNSSPNQKPAADGKDLTDKAVLSGNKIDADKPMVAITFDDGPSKRGTKSILDVLEKYGVVATFFDVGCNVEKHPELVLRESKLGCEIGSHSYSHSDLGKMTEEQLKSDFKSADEAFEKVLGYSPILIRPPYGNLSREVAKTLDRAVILWSVDTLDWKTRNVNKIVKSVKSEKNLDRKCILMHGIYEETAQALDVIIPYLLDKGYQLVTVSEMITVGKNDRIIAGNRYGYSYFR